MKLTLSLTVNIKLILMFNVLLLLSASTCKKEGPDCNRGITFINKSEQNIIYARKFTTNYSKCKLEGKKFRPNESFKELVVGDCWENILKFRALEVYIVDPHHFNQGFFYDCDSIEHYNTVLKHYVLTYDDLDELKRNNFTITYQ